MRSMIVVLVMSPIAGASTIEEVDFWRSANGLPRLVEDQVLTSRSQAKAEYRAARLLKNGHDGPRCPQGCREGTGEASPGWGWLAGLRDGRDRRLRRCRRSHRCRWPALHGPTPQLLQKPDHPASSAVIATDHRRRDHRDLR